MGKFENDIISLVEELIGEKAVRQKTFSWLSNSHLHVSDSKPFRVLDKIFHALHGDLNGLQNKRRRKLNIDAYFEKHNLVLEVDEIQHFTVYRKKTLQLYEENQLHMLGFDIMKYQDYCMVYKEKALKKGATGYRKPKIEFPFELGRAMQRAYFDASRDILVPHKLGAPVLRVNEIDIKKYIHSYEVMEYLRHHISTSCKTEKNWVAK